MAGNEWKFLYPSQGFKEYFLGAKNGSNSKYVIEHMAQLLYIFNESSRNDYTKEMDK